MSSGLLILGVGPHAVEMLDIVRRINQVQDTWNVLAFVSFHDEHTGGTMLDLPVLGATTALEQYPEAFVVPEFEWPEKSKLPRTRLATLIDPSAFVSQTARIGGGCVIYPHCYVGSHAQIGDFLFCLSGSTINHNDVLGDMVTLTSGVTLAGDVHVESECYLGQSCTVREMVRIGHGSLLGMGCVVLHDVAPNSVMIGSPARRLRVRVPKTLGQRAARTARRAMRRGWRTVGQFVFRMGMRSTGSAAPSAGSQQSL